jgi:hypothetical protein
MAIVDYAYYTGTYMGEPIAEADFPRAEAKAERLITQITHGRAANYAALYPFQQQAIMDAICAQVEYYALYGTEVSISGKTADGWTVGKVRVDGGGSKAGNTGAASMVSPSAIAALEQTGLMNPQVHTVGDPPMVGFPWGWGW